MKPVYVEKDGDLRHFIFNFYDSQDKETWELEFERISTISASAFKNVTGLEKARIVGDTMGKYHPHGDSSIYNLSESFHKVQTTREGVKAYAFNYPLLEILDGRGFSECKNISTIVLPECKKLIIEKGAFSGCSVLRSFVSFAEEIDFTENPFEDCPESLTFVGKKNSGLERFAREYGYRFIDD